MLAILSYTKKGICSGIQANEKASELVSVMNMCRNTFHNGTTTYKCYNFMKLLSTYNIFTAKFFRIILDGKTLLYSGLSWIPWLRSEGLRIASKIMPRIFWSTTQSNNAQSTEGTQKERENKAQMQSWKQIQF